MLTHYLILLLSSVSAAIISQQETMYLANNIDGRIIGGAEATTAQFAFSAAIYINTNSGKYFCGGAIIARQWILTAGQCVNGAVLFTIQLGSHLLEGFDDNRLTLATSEYLLHPNYNSTSLTNDVGLIKLRIAITYTVYVNQVFLAYDRLDEYTNLTAIGWGQISDFHDGLSNELHFVNLAAVPNLDCVAVYGNQISDHMVCVAGSYNEGTCIGDTGSPLLHYDSSTRSVRHVGIATFISANGCESLDPSGFTRTFDFENWIRNETSIST